MQLLSKLNKTIPTNRNTFKTNCNYLKAQDKFEPVLFSSFCCLFRLNGDDDDDFGDGDDDDE
jgi:hypothetical protein